MATKRHSDTLCVNSNDLYTANENKTIEDSAREELRRDIQQVVKSSSLSKEEADRQAKGANRSDRRKLKRTIEKAIASDSISMLYPVCCGMDVHKDTIVACLRTVGEKGEKLEEIREFSGFTDDLLSMRQWLLDNDCPIVAMESTGIYWRPVHNILEGSTNIVLVNARHFKNVPGRKTDVKDSKWLAELLQYGLLRGSFIPSREVRDWRELSRFRKKLTKDLGDYKRRIHKVFETANIKIDSVASDLFGVTGRNLIEYLCDSEQITLSGVEERTKGKLRKKVGELYRSLQGFFREHHRFEIQSFLRVIECLEEQISALTTRLRSLMGDHEELLARLRCVPGIEEVAAQSILAELGSDLTMFANENVLCSWAGVAPGNNQSGGKRYSGKSPVKKHPLKEVLVEIAWSAMKKKGSYYKDKYYALKARRGAKKAIVAIAHRILKAVYFIIKHGAVYKELGGEYLEERRLKRKMSFLVRQAKALGYELTPAV